MLLVLLLLLLQLAEAVAASQRACAWIHELQDAPVYYPTPEQFADPIGYIRSIQGKAAKYGAWPGCGTSMLLLSLRCCCVDAQKSRGNSKDLMYSVACDVLSCCRG
jgi:hypothetical protein